MFYYEWFIVSLYMSKFEVTLHRIENNKGLTDWKNDDWETEKEPVLLEVNIIRKIVKI